MIVVILGNGVMMKIIVNVGVYDWLKSRKFKEKRCRYVEEYGIYV